MLFCKLLTDASVCNRKERKNVAKACKEAFLQRFQKGLMPDDISSIVIDIEGDSMPLVNLLMKRLGSKGSIPKLPKGAITPSIITGVAALGRGNDLLKLRAFLETLMGIHRIESFI